MFFKKIFFTILSFLLFIPFSFGIDEQTVMSEYLDEVLNKIRSNITTNIYPDNPVTFEVQIGQNGNLIESKILTSSGNLDFDNHVLDAIKIAAPYKAIPSELNYEYIGARYKIGYEVQSYKANPDEYNLKKGNNNSYEITSGSNNIKRNPYISYTSHSDLDKRLNTSFNEKAPDEIQSVQDYLNKIHKKILYNISHSGKLIGQAQFIGILKIAKDGTLIDCSIGRSTGNQKHDKTIIEIIKKSAPFEPLPNDYKGDFLEYKFMGNNKLYIIN